MTNREAALKTAEIFNHQLMFRVRQRDNVLLMYLGAAGTLLGFSFSWSNKSEILLAIPYLCLGCSIILSHHNKLIGSLLDFLSNDLHNFNVNHCSNDYEKYVMCPQFETTELFKHDISFMLYFRTTGHSIILLLPCIIALYVNKNHMTGPDSEFPFGVVYVGAILLVICSFVLLLWVAISRSWKWTR